MEYRKPYSYDREKYGTILDYDAHSLIINGKRTFIFGGEFHYWRVPDRDRWRDLLLQYKAGGLNTLRIYFLWSFHSPDEGKYLFSGNRDIEYLFHLCEELGFYVFCAAGPYCCAETSAGGIPDWLLAKRDVRIRHLKGTGRKVYDSKYSAAYRDWYAHFVPIMAKHELTTNPTGCVIGFQLENELFRKLCGLTAGLDREMDEVASFAREFGSTVPFFHNDAWLAGAWNGGKSGKAAAVDLYGFDRYIIWCPSKYHTKAAAKGWSLSKVEKQIDSTEKKVRKLGGWAAQTPIFIPELQGGWFNQWGVDHGFDEIYNYYGSEYTKMIVESFIAQGLALFSLYMYYGGTNWGTIGDPDVYTSYDYSACIREFGYLTDRLRLLRQTGIFLKCFEEHILLSENVGKPIIQCTPSHILIRQRHAPSGIDFYFLRNFSRQAKDLFSLSIGKKEQTLKLEGSIAPKFSYICIGNYKIPGFELILSSVPWVGKIPFEGSELWIFRFSQGELLFQDNDFSTFGEIYATTKGKTTRVKFKQPGTAKLRNMKGQLLYFLILSETDANSLVIHKDPENAEMWHLFWGAYMIAMEKNALHIETWAAESVTYLGSKKIPEFVAMRDENLSTMSKRVLPGPDWDCADTIECSQWEQFPVNWSNIDGWRKIDFETERDPLVHLYTHGHITYRCRFSISPIDGKVPTPVTLKINTRHKVTIWVNGRCVGGHITYGMLPGTAGAKNGPDPSFLGAKLYDLTPALHLTTEPNELILLVESLGQNRGPALINDFRNPRGILDAHISHPLENPEWAILGVDVRTAPDNYNFSALPGESQALSEHHANWQKIASPEIHANSGIVWFRTTFEWKKPDSIRCPLYMNLEGAHSIHIFLNGHYIGRYWGDFGPQHVFYIMDSHLKSGKNTIILGTYSKSDGPLTVEIHPYRIDPASGNLDTKNGKKFITKKFVSPF
jgi:hypothetical protein